ncbi:MAG: RNA methyltransferase, partial [Candidatus Thorarchaeota archaeon]
MCIPDTSLTNCRDLREKTVRAGTIARAASVFKVDRIVVYQTGPTQSKRSRDSDLLTLILEYANTPQYLRKRLYPVTDVLRY